MSRKDEITWSLDSLKEIESMTEDVQQSIINKLSEYDKSIEELKKEIQILNKKYEILKNCLEKLVKALKEGLA